jgi:hypothetical protein
MAPINHQTVATTALFNLIKRLNDPRQGFEENDETIDQVILNTYERLSVSERIAILTNAAFGINADKSALICDKICEIPTETEETILTRENQLEVIRLKSWLIKMTVLVALISFICFILITGVFGSGGGFKSVVDFIDYFAKIIKIIFFG